MMMKKILLAGWILGFSFSAQAQTLFTYGKKKVDQEDFLRAFNKNNIQEPDKEKAIREYIDLYVNFKLKVQDAYDEGIDTLPQIVNDIAQFRQQITENYLDNKDGKTQLENEAIERIKKDIHVQHFFVPVTAQATADEKTKAGQAAQALYEGLNKKNPDAELLVRQISQSFSPARSSDLGYITAFSIPYEYENIVYNTETGHTSKPYLNEKGWHLFSLIDTRNSAGRWKVAQILFSFPPDASEDYKTAMQKKADSVYQLLSSHKIDFESAAKHFSNDRLTYMSGGEMPEFGTGKYSGNFEDHVFALQKDGDISKPFSTSFGIHIVKRLSQSPISDITEHPILLMEIKQNIESPDRMEGVNKAFRADLAKKIRFTLKDGVSLSQLLQAVNNGNAHTNTTTEAVQSLSEVEIGKIEKETVLGKEWLDYIRVLQSDKSRFAAQTPEEIWESFLHHRRMDFYRKNLEQYNSEFRFQMEEFKEGNMLFEIMERKVWNKAISDTAGTRKVYEAHKSGYLWQPSADMLVFNTHTEDAARIALDALEKGELWNKIAEDSRGMIQADSGRYELDQIAVTDPNFTLAANAITPLQTGTTGATTFVKILKLYPGNEPRKFEEAKGLAISDYQNILEKNWLAELHKKFPVKLHKKNIKKMIQAEMK